MVPGSYSGLSTNVYQEGVRIPPIKIVERGKINRAAIQLQEIAPLRDARHILRRRSEERIDYVIERL